MMIWANVTEDELKEKKEIQTTFGETLSWDYLCYARKSHYEIPTHILYGEKIILPLMERYLNLYRGLIQHFLL